MAPPVAARSAAATAAPAVHSHHHVQFYETHEFLTESLARFASEGLARGEALIVIATQRTRRRVVRRLAQVGFDVPALQARGQAVLLDARQVLASLLVDGMPERARFEREVGALVAQAQARFHGVRAFGEMVNLLWADGDAAATIALEQLWNGLAQTHAFTLMCGYDMHHFHDASHDAVFQEVCDVHSHVIPAHDFELTALEDGAAQERVIVALQQQARALQLEIAERKKVEHTLQAALQELSVERARFEAVLKQMPAGVVMVDRDGQVVFANAQFTRLLGYAATAVGTESSEQGVPAPHFGPLERALKSGEAVSAEEIDYRQPAGGQLVLDVSAVPIRDEAGRVLAAVATVADVSARKQVEAERIKSSKLESVGLLAAGIAHDFNNILTAILGNVSLAKLVSPSAAAVDVLTQAEHAAVRARDLTQQLLTFSKGGAPIRKAASMEAFLRESLGFALRGSNARLALELAPDLWPAVFDAGQISQVFNNLLINAVQAMPNGGTVTIAAVNAVLEAGNTYGLAPGRYVKIRVTDEGIGIPAEHLTRVFDPYFTTKKTGTGLGLATAYSIMRRHDGYIGACAGEAVGACFRVLLPAATEVERPASASDSSLHCGAGRILLMDDEAPVRAVGSGLLGHLGYDVSTASDGDEALARYRQAQAEGAPFDLVILDLTVPGAMGGRECLDRLRELDPQVKAIVSSGYSTDPVMANHAAHGFRGVISKPYEVADLSDTVCRAIGSARAPA